MSYHDAIEESRKPFFNFRATVQRETAKAVLLRFYEGNSSDVWLPKSQIKHVGTTWGLGGQFPVYQIPNWLVFEKNIYRQRMTEDELIVERAS